MASEAVLLTEDLADRMLSAVRIVEAMQRGPRQIQRGPMLSTTEIFTAAITAGADANGYYPAIISLFDPTSLAYTPYGQCVLRGLNGEALTVGNVYAVLPVGALADGQLLYMAIGNCCVSSGGSGTTDPCEALACPGGLPATICLTITAPVGYIDRTTGQRLVYSFTLTKGGLGATYGALTPFTGCSGTIQPYIQCQIRNGAAGWYLCYNINSSCQGISTSAGNNGLRGFSQFSTTWACSPFSITFADQVVHDSTLLAYDETTIGSCQAAPFLAGTLNFAVAVATGSCPGLGGCTVSSAGLGDAKTTLPDTSLTLASVPVAASSLLVVHAAHLGGDGSVPSLTYQGVAMTLAISKALTGTNGSVGIWYHVSGGAVSGDIVASATGIASALMLSAVNVEGLASNMLDVTHGAVGAASQPDTGATGATATACEYAAAAVLMTRLGGTLAGGAWGGGFTSGGQDVHTGNGTTNGYLMEAYRLLIATGAQDASLAGVTPAPDHWGACLATFK